MALRYPQAVRPWQHVLDPLTGYLMLAQAMVTDPANAPPVLNFGPDADSIRSVRELVEALTDRWGGRLGWRPDTKERPHEASLLTLDATRAWTTLRWRPLLSFDEAVAWTADWYRAFWNGDDVALTRRQIEAFCQRLGPATEASVQLRGTA